MSADFDKAIDGAVREMLDVEPPAGLRRRVLEKLPAGGFQLPASSFRLPASGWVLGAVGAAAVVILAVFLTRGTPQQPETITAGTQPVTAPPTTPATHPPVLEPAVTPAEPAEPPAERRIVVATVAASDVTTDAPPAPGFPRLPALSVPELNVSSIQRPAPVEGPDAIATDPIATPSPLAIEPLPAQGRQSQE